VALLGAAIAFPLLGQGTAAAPADSNDFGQYVVQHQETLAPFFSKNAGDFFRLAIPALLGVAGWVLFITMVVGWALDVLMSRAYAFFYAPAFADWKRAIFYATGSLFLSFLCTALMGLAIVLLLGVSQAQLFIPLAMIVLFLVAVAAQIVWILYLFRTDFGVSIVFYLAVVVVHVIAAFLITQPVMGSRASPDITNFVDSVMTPRLKAEAEATRQQLAAVTGGRNSAQARVTQSQDEIAQAESEQANLQREIEQKKNSDIYAFAQLIKARARGELETARDGLAAFPGKFPDSPLLGQARAQLAALNDQLAVDEAKQKQREADEARAEAAARADLLARAAKGQATLSEIRQALIGRNRTEVSSLFGPPSDTASDQWNYHQRMIVNPLTNEQTGLSVFFLEGTVQSVDYYRGASN
jgi:DNA-binding transcriptional regulator YdaS (Cro superfamily)